MKRKLLFAVLCIVSALCMRAQNVPVFQEMDDFSGTTVSSLTTFVPNGTTYTLELTGCTASTEITVSGGSFSYTPTADGTVRFVRFGSTVYVYEGTTYKGTVEVSTPAAPTYPTGLTSASAENLIQNGGFEDTTDGTYTTDRYKPTHWTPYNKDKGTPDNGVSVRPGSEMTGSYNMLMHNAGYYLTQQLASGVMKNFTPYQIKYNYRANSANQAGAKYKFQVGSEEFKSDYFSSNENNKGTTSVQTFTATFTTPATIVDQPYVQLWRTGYVDNTNKQDLDRFDEFILVAANGGGIGITGATGATFLSGSAYAPEGVLAAEVTAGRYGNGTMRVTNPTFDTNLTGWSSPIGGGSEIKVADNKQDQTRYFYQTWNGTPKEGRMYQVIENLPTGTYELELIAFADQAGTMTPANTTVAVYAQGQEVGTTNSTKIRPNYVNSVNFTSYKAYAYVDASGKLEIGMRQYTPAEFRWLGMDNVTLKYIATDNQEEAKMLALYQEKWTAVKAAFKVDLDATTYEHITGTEREEFSDDIADGVTVSELADYKTNADAAKGTRATFIAAETKNAYDEYFYENQTATRLGSDVSGVSVPTTADEATTAAHEINVINYEKFVAAEYADVSTTVLGDWTDSNVTSRTGEHWDGTTGGDGSQYFEQNEGWSTATVWSMSRQQTVELAPGSYVLKVAARAAAGVNAELSVKVGDNDPIVTYVHHHGGIGKGIDTSGAANFGDGTFANTNGRCWEWRYIPFTVASTGNVTLKFNAENTSGLINQYVGFCNLGIWTDPKVAARTALLTAISSATSARNSTNEGDGVFQIPTSAGTTLASAITTAQGVYDNGEATLEQINAATTAMTAAQTAYEGATLNVPDVDKRYMLTFHCDGHDADGYIITAIHNARNDQGLYGFKYYTASANVNYAQAFKFTQVSGNNYKVSFVGTNGTETYLTTATKGYAAENFHQAIRAIETADDALEIKIIATTTANQFQLYNTLKEAVIGHNGTSNNDMFTNNSATFSIAEATEASVTVSCKAGKFGTAIFPFAPSLPDGVVAYSCAAHNGALLTLVEVAEPQANVPYILYNNSGDDISQDLTGWGTAKQDAYVAGYLTGVYTATSVAAGNYVLQTQGGVQGFYKVGDGGLTAVPYRAYLTVPDEIKAFFFDVTDGISNLGANDDINKNEAIYNLAGQRVQKAVKGLYIKNGRKIVVK